MDLVISPRMLQIKRGSCFRGENQHSEAHFNAPNDLFNDLNDPNDLFNDPNDLHIPHRMIVTSPEYISTSPSSNSITACQTNTAGLSV